jgi:1,4-dihydroxy-2-naphthoate octaprenyltransferase
VSDPAPSRAALWIQGARPRTLGASLVPVIVGTAAAEHATAIRTLGCLVVALGLQVGVNYANDYSDGTKGVDTTARVGPIRLVASGLATPRAVLTAALIAFSAALLYSGGPKPYASLGLGELFVFLFFGLVATAGTAYVQAEHIRDQVWWSAIAVGLLAVAILVANNLRDIPTDTATGKRTLAVRIGDEGTRALYIGVIATAFLMPLLGWALGDLPVGALLSLAAIPLAAGPIRTVRFARGLDLVRVLLGTALLHAQFGLFLAIGLWLS